MSIPLGMSSRRHSCRSSPTITWPVRLALILTALISLPAATQAATTAAAQEVVSVGGFVSVSATMSAALAATSQPAPDVSAVRVELFDSAGIKAAEGDCSPNGYYFVPIDKEGSYNIRVHGPQGWVFAPQQLAISCDAGGCNGGTDVNFELVGLQLSGHVQAGSRASSCKATGPPSFSGDSGVGVLPAGVQEQYMYCLRSCCVDNSVLLDVCKFAVAASAPFVSRLAAVCG